jgi:hypothetical protein
MVQGRCLEVERDKEGFRAAFLNLFTLEEPLK